MRRLPAYFSSCSARRVGPVNGAHHSSCARPGGRSGGSPIGQRGSTSSLAPRWRRQSRAERACPRRRSRRRPAASAGRAADPWPACSSRSLDWRFAAACTSDALAAARSRLADAAVGARLARWLPRILRPVTTPGGATAERREVGRGVILGGLGVAILLIAGLAMLGGAGTGYDLAAYLAAAGRILAGTTPYQPETLGGPFTPGPSGLYLYAPPLALVLTPLTTAPGRERDRRLAAAPRRGADGSPAPSCRSGPGSAARPCWSARSASPSSSTSTSATSASSSSPSWPAAGAGSTGRPDRSPSPSPSSCGRRSPWCPPGRRCVDAGGRSPGRSAPSSSSASRRCRSSGPPPTSTT